MFLNQVFYDGYPYSSLIRELSLTKKEEKTFFCS